MIKFYFKKIMPGFIFFAVIGSLWLPVTGRTEDDQAHRLLVEVDKNLWASTKYVDGRLIIDNGRRVRTLSLESWMEGVTKSYSYYKAPARERGTKMLKLEKNCGCTLLIPTEKF